MNLAHLHYFKTLVETENYQQAARKESITQPTLSQAINGLEKELDCQLFIRKKGSVEPTPEGETFYQYVTASLQFLDNGIDLVHHASGENRREITIGSIYSAQSKNWSQILYEFRKRMHDDVQINIVQSTTQDLLRKVKSGAIDVAFTGKLGEDEDVNFVPCWTQEATLVVNRAHPFAKREKISLNQLKDHYLISYDLKGALADELSSLIAGHDLQISCHYSDEITLASIVAANPDIMAISCRSWLLDAYREEVRTIPIIEAPHDFRQLYLAYQSAAEQPGIVKEFIQLVQESFPQ